MADQFGQCLLHTILKTANFTFPYSGYIKDGIFLHFCASMVSGLVTTMVSALSCQIKSLSHPVIEEFDSVSDATGGDFFLRSGARAGGRLVVEFRSPSFERPSCSRPRSRLCCCMFSPLLPLRCCLSGRICCLFLLKLNHRKQLLSDFLSSSVSACTPFRARAL